MTRLLGATPESWRLLLLLAILALAAALPLSAAEIRLESPRGALQPDQTVALEFIFAPNSRSDMHDVVLTLRCVEVDNDSPAGCTPENGGCADPLRENNRACTDVTVLNSPRPIRSIPAGTKVESQFKIRTAPSFAAGDGTVELVLTADWPGVDLRTSGIGLSRLSLGRPAPAGAEAPTRAEPTRARAPGKDEAMQARIDEYLRKKEARRARRAMQREQQDRGQAMVEPEMPPVQLPPPAAEPETTPAMPQPTRAERRAQRRDARSEMPVEGDEAEPDMEEVLIEDDGDWYVVLPRPLAEAQETIRHSDLGANSGVGRYLDLVDRGEASAHELAAFGNFLAQNGYQQEALVYYDVALSVEPDDSVLWMNAGTLHRQLGANGRALSSYVRALRVDPTNAGAHYNLGATYDSMGRYEEALAEYKIALTLDPALGDPAINPQAANNDRLLAVKTQIYQEQQGNKALPLAEVGDGVKVRVDPAERGDD